MLRNSEEIVSVLAPDIKAALKNAADQLASHGKSEAVEALQVVRKKYGWCQ